MHIIHKFRYDTTENRTCVICHLHQHLISNPITHTWMDVGCDEYKQWVHRDKYEGRKEQLAIDNCSFIEGG